MNQTPPRKLTDHRVNGLNERLEITVCDGPGPGGANHKYSIVGYQNDEPAENWPGGVKVPFIECRIMFQNGPIQSVDDMNGVTNEAILAVLIDRMRGFQHGRKPDGTFDEAIRGKFACRENALALTDLENALMWLQKRTRDRLARGVEGTHTP